MAQTIEFNVTGMTCDHCVNAVTNAVKELEGVSDVSVSLENKSAVVTGSVVDVTKVIAAIEEEGYEAAVK
ncbi:MAG: copper ion binding protein [Dehalococcoidia bacterium]|nr:heavy-metal-associated domain-containing protein [Dehalococcoidia bacterium]MCB9485999.1 heavy-metal-associated domain-containing protein [Thermoflexaceae bacterium]